MALIVPEGTAGVISPRCGLAHGQPTGHGLAISSVFSRAPRAHFHELHANGPSTTLHSPSLPPEGDHHRSDVELQMGWRHHTMAGLARKGVQRLCLWVLCRYTLIPPSISLDTQTVG